MLPLDKDLQKVKLNFFEFGVITKRVLQYLPNVISNSEEKGKYVIYSSRIAGTTKFIRPLNKNLFLENTESFRIHLTN